MERYERREIPIMNIYINSYQPICCTKFGRKAIEKYYPDIHPLEDGSIRREPDFKNSNPGISGLCRPNSMKMIKLSKGDIIVYKTTGSHILTAILEVVEELKDHTAAQKWYQSNNLPVPSNCILEDHVGVEKSHAKDYLKEVKNLSANKGRIERKWNGGYKIRANDPKSSYFFITKPIYNAVHDNVKPIHFIKLESILRKYFNGGLPNTRKRPDSLSIECYQEILDLVK